MTVSLLSLKKIYSLYLNKLTELANLLSLTHKVPHAEDLGMPH